MKLQLTIPSSVSLRDAGLHAKRLFTACLHDSCIVRKPPYDLCIQSTDKPKAKDDEAKA